MAQPEKPQAAQRTRARRLAMQALYQWDMSGNNLSDIEAQFVEEEGFDKADPEYFHELLHKVPDHAVFHAFWADARSDSFQPPPKIQALRASKSR